MKKLTTFPLPPDLFAQERDRFWEVCFRNTSVRYAPRFCVYHPTSSCDKMMTFLLTRNRYLAHARGSFLVSAEQPGPMILVEGRVNVLPEALHHLSTIQDGAGIEAMHDLIRSYFAPHRAGWYERREMPV